MHTLTDDELKREPLKLLDDAARGESTVVTAQGHAVLMTMPLGPQVKVSGALIELAVRLYDTDQISLGRAAEVAGIPYSQMIDELGRRNIDTVRYGADDLARELAHVGTLAGGR
jgi:predicted HTH domain antitoxin